MAKKKNQTKNKPRKDLNQLYSDNVVETAALEVNGFLSGYYNEALSIFHLHQFVNFNELFDQWDAIDSLNDAIQTCAKLSLAHIDRRCLQYDVESVGLLLLDYFDKFQLENKHLICNILFPAATCLINMFVELKVVDYDGYQRIEKQLNDLPGEIVAVINDRLDQPMFIGGVQQQQYMTRLSAVVVNELQNYPCDEFERYLFQVNQFVIMLTGTRISLEPTIH